MIADVSAQLYDTISTTSDDLCCSLEDLICSDDGGVGDHTDVLRLKKATIAYFKNNKLEGSQNVVAQPGSNIPIQTYLDSNAINESTIIIDQGLLFAVFCDQSETVCNFIKQLDTIPKKGILNVIIDLGMSDLNYFAMEAGLMIMNLLKRAKCTKVFNMGSEISTVDLMMAMCCDDEYVSEFASVSIIKADSGERITRYMLPAYKFIVKSIYEHWMKRGLFTPAEVKGLFDSEAENSIQLLSEEIKLRLKKV